MSFAFCNTPSLSVTPSLTCQSVSASDLRVLISGALPSQDVLFALSGVLRICCEFGFQIGIVSLGAFFVVHLQIISETGLDGGDSDTTAWRLP